LKRSESGASVLKSDSNRGYQVLEWAGCRIIRTPTVLRMQLPSTGKTGYACYTVGREAMLASELLGRRFTFRELQIMSSIWRQRY